MKGFYRTHNGRLSFEIEGGSQKEIFEGIASLQEVFEADAQCGVCSNPEIRFRVREVGGNKYYEMYCTDLKCRAKLAYGQNKQGGSLFPKRRGDDDNWLPNRGWHKYVPKENAA